MIFSGALKFALTHFIKPLQIIITTQYLNAQEQTMFLTIPATTTPQVHAGGWKYKFTRERVEGGSKSTFSSTPAGRMMGLNESECGQTGVTKIAATLG